MSTEEKSQMRSRYFLITATSFAVFTSLVHFIAGGQDTVPPLLQSAIATPQRLTLYACWHLVTVALFYSAAILTLASLKKYKNKFEHFVKTISYLWISFALVFIIIAISQLGLQGLVELPQWTLLLPVGVFGLLSTRTQ